MDERSDSIKQFWQARGKLIDDPTIAARLRTDDRLGYDLELVLRHCRRNARILDLGAGTCEMSANLAPYAREIVAVDFVGDLLRKRPLPPNVTPVVCDIRSFRIPEQFDSVLLYGVLTYVLDDREVAGVYKNVSRMMSPGAVCIVRHQSGVHGTVEIDQFSAEIGTRYVGIYRHIDRDLALLRQVFDVEVVDIYPPYLNRWDNTHFYGFVCRLPIPLEPVMEQPAKVAAPRRLVPALT